MHEVEYRLKISARHPSSGKVSNTFRRFCAKFGREVNVGDRREILHGPFSTVGGISSDEGKEQFFSNVPVAFARVTLVF
jgi:hypothetical protein